MATIPHTHVPCCVVSFVMLQEATFDADPVFINTSRMIDENSPQGEGLGDEGLPGQWEWQ